MKLVRFTYKKEKFIGKLEDKKVYKLKNKLKIKDDSLEMLKTYPTLKDLEFENDGIDLDELRLLSPIARTENDLLCVGLNYRSHIEETRGTFENDAYATYFSKRAQVISGPEDFINLDPNIDDAMDYETELGIIIGIEGLNISPEEALDYVYGYTIINDYSARSLQKRHKQFFKGKSLDGYTAIGPSIVTKDEIKDPQNLNLKTRINGEERQNSNTKYMIRNVATLISELSQGLTLVPGDIIATGTPKGVGLGFNPPKFLKADDVVESEIEAIGVLRNTIR